MSRGSASGGAGGEPEHPEAAPRSVGRLLLDPTIGPYVASKFLSAIGIWIHNVVAAIVVFEVTGSALMVGAVSIAQFVPQVLFAPWAGAIADRRSRKLQIVVSRAVTTIGSGFLALWIAVSGVEGLDSATPVLAAALMVGISFAISAPATQAMVPALARPSELASVIAVDNLPFTLARAAGPAIGGLLLVSAGPAAAFGVAAATHLVYAVVVLRLRLRPVGSKRALGRSVLVGVQFIRRNRVLALLLLGVVGVGFGADPVITLTPSLAADLGQGANLVALMAAAFGLGAALTPLLLDVLQRRVDEAHIASGGLVVLAGSMAALAVTPTAGTALICWVVAGTGMMASITNLTAQLQRLLPDELRGRIMALWSVAFMGSRPFAAALNGALADVLSPRLAFLAMTALLLAVAWVVRPARIQAP